MTQFTFSDMIRLRGTLVTLTKRGKDKRVISGGKAQWQAMIVPTPLLMRA
jgi:hypothetical protein